MSSTPVSHESDAKPSAYCRKEKSLGVLCANFLRLYDREEVNTVGLDDAATQLGVERRRMYDVVNILEIVGVVARRAKNQYTWNGVGHIPQALEQLREEGIAENFSASIRCTTAIMTNDEEYKTLLGLNTKGEDLSSASCKNRNKRDKSLALLTQNFIKLFLCSKVDFILLENAAKALPGDADDATALRTKVRRLYDIANVLSSVNLIEKIRHPDSGKPAYRWLRLREKQQSDDVSASRKRKFGTELSNFDFKRKRETTAVDCILKQEVSGQTTIYDGEDSKEAIKPTSNGIEFGPFGPIYRATVEDSKETLKPAPTGIEFGPFAPTCRAKPEGAESKKTVQVQDWESLASTYRPRYQNQALYELFGHYMEAWKSWFVDAVRSPHMQQTC